MSYQRSNLNDIFHWKTLMMSVLLWMTFLGFAQQPTFKELTRINQLPVNSVHRIFQDSEGFIWYGTVDGLCRDDGYSIHTFRSDFKSPGVLKTNLILSISEDSLHRLWIGTPKGAYRLDKRTYHLSEVDLPEWNNSEVHSLFTSSDGTVWLGVQDKVFRIVSPFRKAILCKSEGLRPTGRLTMIFEDRQHRIFACFNGLGLCYWNTLKQAFQVVDAYSSGIHATEMIQDGSCYWISTWDRGIVRFEPSAGTKTNPFRFQHPPLNAVGKPSSVFFHLAKDVSKGYIWATSLDDLYAFQVDRQGNLEQVPTGAFLPYGNKMLYEIIRDGSGNLWVSGFDRKSFTIGFEPNGIESFDLRPLRERIKGNPAIVTLCRDESGTFWFSQERIGLCVYSPTRQLVRHFSDFEALRSLPLDVIPLLIKSAQPGKVWVMSSDAKVFGLSQEGLVMKRTDEIDLSKTIGRDEPIESIYEDHLLRLWIGTLNGLYVYDGRTRSVKAIDATIGNISDLVQTNDRKIWATVRNRGLLEIDTDGHKQLHSNSKDFLCMDCTTDGTLWLGTGEGSVLSFHPDRKDEWVDHTLDAGMNGDMVDNIAADQYNHIWLLTNQRIKEFNPSNKALWTLEASDPGNLLDRFLPRAIAKHSDGRLYFGGFGGIISTQPSQRLEGIPMAVKPKITNIQVSGKSLMFDRRAERIEIQPNEQNLKIEFSTLDYLHAARIRYAYRMEGVDNDWTELPPGKNSAFYNKLPNGNHVFQVKATDRNGLWSTEVAEVEITRLPAWYETWLARSLYLLLIFIALATGIKEYRKRLVRKNNEQWSDSAELLKMRNYLETNSGNDFELAALDKLLLDRLCQSVEIHLADSDFNVDSLANSLNMSRSTLSRKIKLITGKTPLDFIKDIKMQKAKQLLESKTATVAEVILAVGYSDHKNFTQSFKEAFGVNPGEFIRQKRQNNDCNEVNTANSVKQVGEISQNDDDSFPPMN